MMNFLGAIVPVEKYLSKSDFNITIIKDGGDAQNLTFSKNRIYSIPSFQREIRWDSENVNTLLSDLSNGPQFLGNTILSNKNNNAYEILDGQQRTTVMSMIIECIKSKYNGEIETFELCPLYNESFTAFNEILQRGFNLPTDELDKYLQTDAYNQYSRLLNLWNIISNSDIIKDRYKTIKLIDNLKSSEVNIIYSNSQSQSKSIRYFLDVNLKGVKLDTEDIFKSYLFSQNTEDRIRTLWQNNKQLNIKLNSAKNGKVDKRYPLMKLYEHYFYCDLYLPKANGQDFSELKFGEDFCISDTVNLGENTFYKGTHLVEAICNKKYLLNSMNRINKVLTVMLDIIESGSPSDKFKQEFLLESEKVDYTEISIIHTILQKILLDREIIPKVLALKYILSYFDGNHHKKEEYKNIYSVFVASVFFTVFANKKESDTFYSFVKSENWIFKINEWLKGYAISHELTRGKLLAAYKYSEPKDDDFSDDVRCKSLAAIFNYIIMKKVGDKFIIKTNNCNHLKEFFSNTEKYNLEHFIIANSGKLQIKTTKFDFPFEYPSQIKKYRNSLFNYIFIPHSINEGLNNEPIYKKLSKLNEEIKNIDCLYSKEYLDLIKSEQYFTNYPSDEEIDSCDTEENAKQLLKEYFENEFPNEYLTFATVLIHKFKI